jgi:hypothetical protein
MILWGESLVGDVVEDISWRHVGSRDLILFSNAGLLRDGPQIVGWRNPS